MLQCEILITPSQDSDLSDTRLSWQVGSNVLGVMIALASVVSTALYQIWAGSKQKELSASSAQLLREYTPYASLLMGLLVGIFEPIGIPDKGPGAGQSTPNACDSPICGGVCGRLCRRALVDCCLLAPANSEGSAHLL